ncbi:MAG: C40 family peptidase [Oscillospiraceae bacterium]|nr:C40 family peptidase [Oscillospiraceae bacterium]
MATANQLLTIARKQLGICENPPSSNNVRYNTWYYGREVMGSAYPWCMVFVQWVFAQAGVKLPVRTASCGALMNAAKSAGCWVTAGFKPGDVVIYDFPGGAATDHCGIVETELPDYGVQAVEGNTSQSGSQSNGGMVCRKNRPGKYIVGAVRPVFDKEKEEDDMVIYKTLNDVPSHYKAAVQKAMDKDALKGTSGKEINVSEDLCRTLTVLDRLGKLD